MIDVTFSSALENATREKVVLTLGLDPTISGKAFEASRLYLAWAEAGKRLEEFKNEFRTYVSEKRDFWNEANEDKVTTLKIPFRLKTERGVEVRFISVSCTATYTVDKIVIHKFKRECPVEYKELFVEETTTLVRHGGEDLLRRYLESAKFSPAKIDSIFSQIFTTETDIKPVEDFEFKKEDVLRKASDVAKKYVELGVRRAAPAVTFEVR